MTARTALDLLPAVRDYVLGQAALGYKSLGLTGAAWRVAQLSTWACTDRGGKGNSPSSFSRLNTMGPVRLRWSKPTRRGHVQHCLSHLAKSGLVRERQRPECGHHYEWADKYFQILISQDDAIAELKKAGKFVPYHDKSKSSAHWTPSLAEA